MEKLRKTTKNFSYFIVSYIYVLLSYTRVEAGSNTSTVTLRVVEGDEIGLNRPRHSLSG
jgi:hypothetical protein